MLNIRSLTPVDLGILVLAGVLVICFLVCGWLLAAPYPAVLGILIVELMRLYRSRKRFSRAVPGKARVVNYHVETRTDHRRYQPSEVYQVWRPVVEFETPRGTVKADYPVYSRERWFHDDTEYEIFYCPDQPEYFYFACRQDELVNESEGGLLVFGIIAAAYTVALLICYMNA